ncbi:phage major capsid protein [Nitrobacter sp.]|uniref:phage major capsid protein n=1 Tax=Nitrobacter sp. TaxID=29420 RepID=UPI003F64B0DA
MNSSLALELKDGNDADPAETVTKALDELKTSVDARLKDIETKSANDNKLADRLDKLEAKLNRPGVRHDNDNEPEETKAAKAAFGTYLRNGKQGVSPLELKSLIVSGDPQGGYLAPAEFSSEFIRDLLQYSPIRGLASVRQTALSSVIYPSRTGRSDAKWTGEAQAQGTGEPTFGQVEIAPKEITTYIDISNQLLADSAGAAEAEVRMALSEDFGLKEGTAFLKGAGPLQPEGVLTNANVTVKATGNASTLGTSPADLLIDVMYDLPTPYRGNATWLMNSRTLAAMRKLKDGQGNYLWQPSYQVGQPETILGRPVVECPDMDDVGAGTVPILFGDFATAYRIIDRLALSIMVNPYLLATNSTTRIHATRRVGGGVVQAAALRKIKCAV